MCVVLKETTQQYRYVWGESEYIALGTTESEELGWMGFAFVFIFSVFPK